MRLACSFLFLSVTASTPAFASNYAGATCLKASTTGILDLDGDGFVENDGTGQLNLVCPIVIDDPYQLPLDTRVWVTDLSGTGNVCCEWRVRSPTSSTQFGGDDCTANSPGYDELSPASPFALSSNGARFLYCEVPAIDPNGPSGGVSEIRAFTYDSF